MKTCYICQSPLEKIDIKYSPEDVIWHCPVKSFDKAEDNFHSHSHFFYGNSDYLEDSPLPGYWYEFRLDRFYVVCGFTHDPNEKISRLYRLESGAADYEDSDYNLLVPGWLEYSDNLQEQIENLLILG